MTLDLARALHDAVDGPSATGAGGLDDARLAHVTRRVARRRAARTAARTGAGLAAGVAVTLGAVQLAGRTGTVPAADADAEPGTCGSAVSALEAFGSPPTVTVRPAHSVRPDEGFAFSDDAGVRTGRDAVHAWSPADGLLSEGRLALDVEFRYAGDARVDGSVPTPWAVVARDGVVVATARHESDEARGWHVTTGQAGFVLDAVVRPCGTGSPGPLPPGEYEVRAVALDAPGPGASWIAVSEPVTVRVGSEPRPLAGLPAGFPAGVPVVGERVIEARELDGSLARGWVVTVAVDTIDAAELAWRALGSPAGEMTSPDGAWTITLRNDVDDDGRTTLVYRLTPR